MLDWLEKLLKKPAAVNTSHRLTAEDHPLWDYAFEQSNTALVRAGIGENITEADFLSVAELRRVQALFFLYGAEWAAAHPQVTQEAMTRASALQGDRCRDMLRIPVSFKSWRRGRCDHE